jgi:hypothetical protein
MSRRLVVAGVLRRRSASALDRAEGAALRVHEPAVDDRPPVGVGPVRRAPLGPLQARPDGVSLRVAAEMLRTAVEGLPLGRADRAALVRVGRALPAADLVVLASVIERARVEGPVPALALVGGGTW